MSALEHVFGKFERKKILVAGDFMLDSYTIGSTKRISPEAPVPVVMVTGHKSSPGGAGNVALNLVSLGMDVAVLGRIGLDDTGKAICDLLSNEKIDTSGLFSQFPYQTPKKERIIVSSQQLLRLDYEKTDNLTKDIEEKVIQHIEKYISDYDLVAISDYAKGFLTDSMLRALIEKARAHKIPVIVDPKGVDFVKYRHATVIKPNLHEAYSAVNLVDGSLDDVAKALFNTTEADSLMITRSEAGISIFYPNAERADFPAFQSREIRDVTGAGDTVLAVVAATLANHLSLEHAAELANVAANLAVERIGCARITLAEIASAYINSKRTNSAFRKEDHAVLKSALAGKDFIQLKLEKECELDQKLLKTLQTLSDKHQKELLVTVKESPQAKELVELLSSFKNVDYIHIEDQEGPCFIDLTPTHAYSYSLNELKKL